ncbi:GTP binding protein [Aureococcus anophagefferens]|nr:GTP binding protein [Aureococcus anophagefferens]
MLAAVARGLRPSARPSFRRGRTITMGLKTGIVGLPNVGKSTLFNALTEDVNAEAANYPFCTIEPNVGVVSVPDARLSALSDIHDSEKTVATSLEFVDIAGLVKGASKGEGLGNQFLANIRECDAIVHVVRCFDDENVIHVDGSIDPLRDVDVIELELALSDLAQVEKRRERAGKDAKTGKAPPCAPPEEIPALDKLAAALDEGTQARDVALEDKELEAVKGLNLLTIKPVIYACNVADDDLAEGNAMVEKVRAKAAETGETVVVVSAQVESELVTLEAEDRDEFSTLGVSPRPAASARSSPERRLVRAEGKEYVVKDGDVMLFRFNV